MKILQVIQKPQLRGAEIFACQLSRELRKLGHEVDLVCLFADGSGLKEMFPDLRFLFLKGDHKIRLFDVQAFRHLASLIRKGNYDLVQANASDTLKYAVLSKKMFGWKGPLVYRNASKMGSFVKNRLHRMFLQWLLNGTDYVISVSENCRMDLLSLFPKHENSSVTIPIGTYRFDDVPPVERPADTEVFISIGSFAPEKNHLFLIDIFEAYYRKHGKGVLWFVGNGKLQVKLHEKVKNLQLENAVHFWGFRNDVIAILKAADALVMPSLIEGMPGVILEALSCRIPVIAAEVGGIPEVIYNNVNGYCLTGFNAEEYVKCMEVLVSNPEVRQSFTAAGYQLINEHYLMHVIAKRFEEKYFQITTARRSS